MRIEAFYALVAEVWLTAVFCIQLVAASNQTNFFFPRKPRDHLGDQFNRWSFNDTTTGLMAYPEVQELIRHEAGENGLPVECCPTVEEMVEPMGGRNQLNMYVELFRSEQNSQRFYEYSCRPDVLNKPCRFVDRKLQAQTRCVQKFSYSYAIVRNPDYEQHRHRHRPERSSQPQQFPTLPGNADASEWTLDYIRVRSGCSCEIIPKTKKKKAASKVKNTRSKGHHSAKAIPNTTVDYSPEV